MNEKKFILILDESMEALRRGDIPPLTDREKFLLRNARKYKRFSIDGKPITIKGDVVQDE